MVVISQNDLQRERKRLVQFSENNSSEDLCIIREKGINEKGMIGFLERGGSLGTSHMRVLEFG